MTPTFGRHGLELRRAADAPGGGEPLSRQPPPCLDGMDTVNCLRPFFRRLLRTSRPHRSFMRARNPCLFTRRLLRGL